MIAAFSWRTLVAGMALWSSLDQRVCSEEAAISWSPSDLVRRLHEGEPAEWNALRAELGIQGARLGDSVLVDAGTIEVHSDGREAVAGVWVRTEDDDADGEAAVKLIFRQDSKGWIFEGWTDELSIYNGSPTFLRPTGGPSFLCFKNRTSHGTGIVTYDMVLIQIGPLGSHEALRFPSDAHFQDWGGTYSSHAESESEIKSENGEIRVEVSYDMSFGSQYPQDPEVEVFTDQRAYSWTWDTAKQLFRPSRPMTCADRRWLTAVDDWPSDAELLALHKQAILAGLPKASEGQRQALSRILDGAPDSADAKEIREALAATDSK